MANSTHRPDSRIDLPRLPAQYMHTVSSNGSSVQRRVACIQVQRCPTPFPARRPSSPPRFLLGRYQCRRVVQRHNGAPARRLRGIDISIPRPDSFITVSTNYRDARRQGNRPHTLTLCQMHVHTDAGGVGGRQQPALTDNRVHPSRRWRLFPPPLC